MTGAEIVGELLYGYTPLTTLVPVERIKGGRLPADTPLDAIVVATLGGAERQRLKRGTMVRRTDRVRVTVRAVSYDAQLRIVDLITEACAGRTGTIAGAQRVSVLAAGRGPDLDGPVDSFEQAQDFRVSFDKPVP